MDDLKDVREKILRTIIQTENLPIMAENFMERAFGEGQINENCL